MSTASGMANGPAPSQCAIASGGSQAVIRLSITKASASQRIRNQAVVADAVRKTCARSASFQKRQTGFAATPCFADLQQDVGFTVICNASLVDRSPIHVRNIVP